MPRYTYAPAPGEPAVSVIRIARGAMDGIEEGHAHVHDFPLLGYFERGGGSLRLAGRTRPLRAGDVYLVAPHEVVGVGEDPAGLAEAQGWGVFFPADALAPEASGALLSWRAHPLLFPFVRGAAGGAQRLSVPEADRRSWSDRLSALHGELTNRSDGYAEAVRAHLTLLLVAVGRLAADVAADFRLQDEPLLAEVFAYIEEHYAEPVSLRDVATAVSLTPGHLTTVVRRKTGRPVQEWITERRMAQARRLLASTGLNVAEVALAVGYPDANYFARAFKRAHGATPRRWGAASGPS